MTPPVIVTRDPALREELLRLAAAAGVSPFVADDWASCIRVYAVAPLVLVGADVAAEVADLSPPRRDALHVVALGEVAPGVWRTALELGARTVTQLPDSAEWVVEQFLDVDPAERREGRLIGVVAGSGGAGASVFAAALGQVAARQTPSLVIDADPLGPGLDRVLGLEGRDGVRWSDLHQTAGRLSARALRDAVPRRDGVGVVTWGPLGGSLQPFAVRDVVAAAVRGHDTVVVDLPRSTGDFVGEMAGRCDAVVVVTQASVRGLASAARMCGALSDSALIAVTRRTDVAARDVARVLGVPLVLEMGHQRGLDEAIDLGVGPVRSRRGPLGRLATDILHRLADPSAAGVIQLDRGAA